MKIRAATAALPLLLSLAATACSGSFDGRGGVALSQSRAEVRGVMDRLVPTTRHVPAPHADVLWRAARGYMEEMFPVEPPPPDAKPRKPGERAVESSLIEWVEGPLPHRTRVVARVAKEGDRTARLEVTALLIEATPLLSDARDGVAIVYDWRLVGSNPKIEEVVAEGVMRRYLALVEGRPAPPLEFERLHPIPGMTPRAAAAESAPASGRGL
jgi:hypothetical protein